ncbi:unnamed protein product [Anisakis simplex]|uniref:Galectin n=1 Tax=Anisakis simplex TaxID=6269 RepID=A0A0M3IZ28_ANISI|nr:unnamed protein product [Anisakis simplex]
MLVFSQFCSKMVVLLVMILCFTVITSDAYISFMNLPSVGLTHDKDGYTSGLFSPLRAGQMIVVTGRVNNDAKRFTVSLMRGASYMRAPGAEAVLHIDVRFDENQVVMNTMEKTLKWGEEERAPNPFKRGRSFYLLIRIDTDKFGIMADHEKVHDFKMRLDLKTIEYLTVTGDVTEVNGRWSAGWANTLPMRHFFEGGHWKIGSRFTVYGKVKNGVFEIQLIAWYGDILFSLKTRFYYKDIVINARLEGYWGKEERVKVYPFKPRTQFALEFLNTLDSIQVFNDGKQICTFKHRTDNPTYDYNLLFIYGDLVLDSVQFDI